jgi:hypothetical protein
MKVSTLEHLSIKPLSYGVKRDTTEKFSMAIMLMFGPLVALLTSYSVKNILSGKVETPMILWATFVIMMSFSVIKNGPKYQRKQKILSPNVW